MFSQGNLKHHLFEVQTEIVERLALEDGAGVFRLIREHKVRKLYCQLHVTTLKILYIDVR